MTGSIGSEADCGRSSSRNIELRRVQRLFLERGLESARKARESGTYVPARDVLHKLSARLDQARAEHDFI